MDEEDFWVRPIPECENEGPFVRSGHWDEITLTMKMPAEVGASTGEGEHEQ